MPSPPQQRVHEHSVLHLGPSRVAWLTRGKDPEVHQESYDPETTTPVQAALDLLAAHKERRRTCILGIGQGFYQRRQFDLPADLGGRELREVLRRKACGLLDDGAEAVYQALPLGGNRKKGREGIQAWLVFAVPASLLRDLLKGLVKKGFTIVRVVATEVAYQGLAPMDLLEEGQAAIVVGHLETAVGISLITSDGLVTQNLVPTGALDRESMASTLVQELRAMDAFWRKMNEGGTVTRATFVGFDEAWADTIAPAAQLILSDVELVFDKEARQTSCGFGSCVRALSACRAQSLISVEFTLRISPQRKVGILLGAASVAAAVTIGSFAGDQLVRRSGFIEGDLQMKMAREETQHNIQETQKGLAAIRSAKAEFDAEWKAFAGTGTSSLPFDRITGDVLGALGSGSVLESLKVDSEGPTVSFQLVAVAPSDALKASVAMGQAVRALEGAGAYQDILLEPETRVPSGRDHVQLMRFTIKGTWDPRLGVGPSMEQGS